MLLLASLSGLPLASCLLPACVSVDLCVRVCAAPPRQFMPKRTPRRRRHSAGGSPGPVPEPEAEPEAEFGTPRVAADAGVELAQVRAN